MHGDTSENGNRIPRTVWILRIVSLLMDVSSEMTHSLLPAFMVGVLGASATMVGLVEGIAEATALMAKVFSSVVSDHVGRRKQWRCSPGGERDGRRVVGPFRRGKHVHCRRRICLGRPGDRAVPGAHACACMSRLKLGLIGW